MWVYTEWFHGACAGFAAGGLFSVAIMFSAVAFDKRFAKTLTPVGEALEELRTLIRDIRKDEMDSSVYDGFIERSKDPNLES
jgi:hypothetical protein